MNKSIITNVSKVLLIVVLLQFTSPLIANIITLKNGTLLQVSLSQTVKGKTAQIGQRVSFRLLHDVKINGKIVIPSGTNAIGEIVDANAPGMVGKPGALTIQIKSIQAIDGSNVPLSASRVIKGEDKTILAVILTLLCIVGLFTEGGDASLQQGTIIEAYTIGDVDIELE